MNCLMARALYLNMKELPIRHPEGIPEPALFSLDELYQIQPVETIKLQVNHLVSLNQISEHLISWIGIELLDRKDGVEDLPKGFIDFQEDVEEDSNEFLEDALQIHRDKILTILSHYAVIMRVAPLPL